MSSDKRVSLPVLSLFSGSGGFDVGFSQAGFSPILAIDHNEASCQTLRANYPDTTVVKRDLSRMQSRSLISLVKRTFPASPLGVIGGPPCQAFSRSNGWKKANDPRAKLSRKYASLLRDLNEEFALDFFVFENVVGLTYRQHWDDWYRVRELFSEAGFHIFEGVMDARNFGVAQERRRIIIVGFNKVKYPHIEFSFPPGSSAVPKTVADAISGLPEPLEFRRGIHAGEIPFHPNHWCMRPKSRRFCDGSLKQGEIKGRAFRVLSWKKPSWTVAYGHREVHIHPSGRRRLSVFEAMCLQGFPHDYELRGTLSDQIRLVSDAVSPPVAHALAKSIHVAMRDARKPASEMTPEARVLWDSRFGKPVKADLVTLRDFFVKYAKNNLRSFPWRSKKTSTFQLLVTEMLLKQTRAESVAEVFPLLVREYPSPHALANANIKSLMAVLAPLGLQRQRAHELKSMATAVLQNFYGKVPRTIRELLSLPGVGLYAATAVATFKLRARVPIVDANVLRVLGRVVGQDFGSDLRRSTQAWTTAWNILPLEGWREHNYGLLDFGAQVCSTTPRCTTCSLNVHCRFAKNISSRKR